MGALRKAPRVDALVEYCRETFAQTGASPSYSMICDALGFTDRGTVRQHVLLAAKRGLLELSDDYRGGRGPRQGQRIRMGRPEEAEPARIKMGREL